VKTVAGAIEVTAPRVDDKRVDGESGERQEFHSSILLPWCRRARRSRRYCHCCICTDSRRVTSCRPCRSSSATEPGYLDRRRPPDENLAGRAEASPRARWPRVDYVYIWVDGVHFNVRLGDDRLCCLVVVGVRADGRKEARGHHRRLPRVDRVLASLLRDCKHRGMRAPGARCRRRAPRVLGGGARRLS